MSGGKKFSVRAAVAGFSATVGVGLGILAALTRNFGDTLFTLVVLALATLVVGIIVAIIGGYSRRVSLAVALGACLPIIAWGAYGRFTQMGNMAADSKRFTEASKHVAVYYAEGFPKIPGLEPAWGYPNIVTFTSRDSSKVLAGKLEALLQPGWSKIEAMEMFRYARPAKKGVDSIYLQPINKSSMMDYMHSDGNSLLTWPATTFCTAVVMNRESEALKLATPEFAKRAGKLADVLAEVPSREVATPEIAERKAATALLRVRISKEGRTRYVHCPMKKIGIFWFVDGFELEPY